MPKSERFSADSSAGIIFIFAYILYYITGSAFPIKYIEGWIIRSRSTWDSVYNSGLRVM